MRRFQAEGQIPTLADALSDLMNAGDLKRLAALTPEKLPTRKADLAAVIVRHLGEDGLHAVWQGLNELQRAAVAEVVHSSSTQFHADRFRAKYGRDPEWGSADRYGAIRNPSPLCFFFYADRVMPDDLKERLEAFVPEPVPATIESLEQLPAVHERPYQRWNSDTKTKERGTEPIPLTVRETERSAQRELLSVLRLVDAGKVAVSDATRRASSATLDAITAVLDGGDYYPFEPPKGRWCDGNTGPLRAFAWPLLIQAGGLAQLSGSRLQLTKAGRTALAAPAAQTLRILWEKWMGTTLLDELSRIECVKGQTGKGKRGLTAVSSRREAIASALAECPARRWIAADELLRFLRASEDDFAVSRNAWNLYVGELQYGSLGYAGCEGILDRPYLLCLLFEYASTLGLVDVAFIPPAGARQDHGDLWGTDELPFFSRYDGLVFFRITALGAFCLGISREYERVPVEVKPVLRVLPHLEIETIGTVEQGDRLALDAYAVRVSDSVWRLEASKLLAATEEGRTVGEIREFLSARGGAPIPDPVSRLLADVDERCTRVHDRGPARLVECEEAELALLLANDARTRKHCMRAGERHLVVPAPSEAAFRRALRELGYLLATGAARSAKDRVVASAQP
jgi:hypothetical protein